MPDWKFSKPQSIDLILGGMPIAKIEYGDEWISILTTSLECNTEGKKSEIRILENKLNHYILIVASISETTQGSEMITTGTTQFFLSKGEFLNTYGIGDTTKKSLLKIADKFTSYFIDKRMLIKIQTISDIALYDSAINILQPILNRIPVDSLQKYGIRTLVKEENLPIKKGTEIGRSSLRLNVFNAPKLKGTSVIGLDFNYNKQIKKFLWVTLISAMIRYRMENEYFALVKGIFVEEGNDPFENILKKAKVIHLFDIVDLKGEEIIVKQLKKIF